MKKIYLSTRVFVMIGVMSLLIFAGCSDLIEPAETSEYTLMEHAPPLVKDARSLMQRKGEFFLLNMYKRDKQEMVCEHHSEHKDCKHHDEHECCDHHSHHQCIHHQESHKNDEHRAKLEKEGRISSKNLKVKPYFRKVVACSFCSYFLPLSHSLSMPI